VLLGYLLQWANEQQRAAFDFMRGDEEYKYRFGAIDPVCLPGNGAEVIQLNLSSGLEASAGPNPPSGLEASAGPNPPSGLEALAGKPYRIILASLTHQFELLAVAGSKTRHGGAAFRASPLRGDAIIMDGIAVALDQLGPALRAVGAFVLATRPGMLPA